MARRNEPSDNRIRLNIVNTERKMQNINIV